MRGVSNQDDLNHATNVFTKHDHYHFISEVSNSNLLQKITEGKEKLKLNFYELHHSISEQRSKP